MIDKTPVMKVTPDPWIDEQMYNLGVKFAENKSDWLSLDPCLPRTTFDTTSKRAILREGESLLKRIIGRSFVKRCLYRLNPSTIDSDAAFVPSYAVACWDASLCPCIVLIRLNSRLGIRPC